MLKKWSIDSILENYAHPCSLVPKIINVLTCMVIATDFSLLLYYVKHCNFTCFWNFDINIPCVHSSVCCFCAHLSLCEVAAYFYFCIIFPLIEEFIFYLAVLLFMSISILSFEWLQIILSWMLNISVDEHVYTFLLGIYLGIELLGYRVCVYVAKCFLKVILHIYNSISSMRISIALHSWKL